jgi:hypothetical protein
MKREMVAAGVNLASGKNLDNQKEQGGVGKIARKPFAGLENTLAAPGKANASANAGKDALGGDARRDFFFDNFIKRVNMPELKKELKIEADEEEDEIVMRQKENRRLKKMAYERGQNLANKKTTIREKQALIKKAYNDHRKSSISKKNIKKSPSVIKTRQLVTKTSRRILKPAFGQQMVLIRREKTSDQDKSQAILNFKNTAGNNALFKARQDFEDSETNFLGLSDDEKSRKNDGKKAEFGVVFERKNDAGTVSERKRLYSNNSIEYNMESGDKRNHKNCYSKSTKKLFATPKMESSTKKKNRAKEVIDIGSDDGDGDSVFLTMDDWNANIVAFNTPYKEEDAWAKNLKSSYRRQLNFDPLLTTNSRGNPMKDEKLQNLHTPNFEPSSMTLKKGEQDRIKDSQMIQEEILGSGVKRTGNSSHIFRETDGPQGGDTGGSKHP